MRERHDEDGSWWLDDKSFHNVGIARRMPH
jgi:hypothetical protein